MPIDVERSHLSGPAYCPTGLREWQTLGLSPSEADPIEERLHYVKLSDAVILEGTLADLRKVSKNLEALGRKLEHEHKIARTTIRRTDGGRDL